MPLNLTEQDQARYREECEVLQRAKEAAIADGDAKAAKRARQALTALYKKYELLQLPAPPMSDYETELAMSLEDRIARIEQHLKIGLFAN